MTIVLALMAVTEAISEEPSVSATPPLAALRRRAAVVITRLRLTLTVTPPSASRPLIKPTVEPDVLWSSKMESFSPADAESVMTRQNKTTAGSLRPPREIRRDVLFHIEI